MDLPEQARELRAEEGPEINAEWLSLRWEEGTRYYEVHLHQDLWGDWVLTQVWGRRGTELGRMVHTPCASYQDGRERLAAVQARRRQKGYTVLFTDSPSS
jgi:predicted DNA-binding WGR domain protein